MGVPLLTHLLLICLHALRWFVQMDYKTDKVSFLRVLVWILFNFLVQTFPTLNIFFWYPDKWGGRKWKHQINQSSFGVSAHFFLSPFHIFKEIYFGWFHISVENCFLLDIGPVLFSEFGIDFMIQFDKMSNGEQWKFFSDILKKKDSMEFPLRV